MANNPFDIFDKSYCIHLPNPKRMKLIQKQFQKVGIRDTRFVHADPPDAGFKMSNFVRSPPGEFGCNLSQIKAIVHAIADAAQIPIFFEDDINFHKDAVSILESALNDIPDDWEVLYLGGHPRGPYHQVGNHLVKMSKMSFGDAYCLKRGSLLSFFDYWCNRISKKKAAYDMILGDFVESRKGYAVYPMICEQYVGVSQITNKVEDKTVYTNRGWKKYRR